MNDCIFCKILNDEIPSIRLYEDDKVIAMMDIFPESEGHFLLIPKQHVDNLFDITDDTLTHLILLSKKLAVTAQKALNADGIRIAQFNGESAGQTVFHYHLHIIPSYINKKSKPHGSTPADPQQLSQIAAKIKAALS